MSMVLNEHTKLSSVVDFNLKQGYTKLLDLS